MLFTSATHTDHSHRTIGTWLLVAGPDFLTSFVLPDATAFMRNIPLARQST